MGAMLGSTSTASAAARAYVQESDPATVRLFYHTDGLYIQNNVTITSPSPGSYRITDPGDAITPGTGCSAIDSNTVTCTDLRIFKLIVDVGRSDDTVTIGTGTATEIHGGSGSDTILGGSGSDEILGDESCITLSVFGGCSDWRVPLAGDTTNDTLDGRGGDDTIDGEYSGTIVSGWPDRDSTLNTVRGGSGNDTLDFGRLIGGSGSDTLGVGTADYSESGAGVSVSLDGVANDGLPSEGDNVSSGAVIGTIFQDSLVGDDGPQEFDGRGGPDNLLGQGGNDVLVEGGGNGDNVNGGDGIDTASFAGRSENLSLTLDGLANDGATGEGDSITNTEKLIGGTAGDVLVGNADAFGQWLEGGPGADTLRDGGGPKDFLRGGDGLDFADYSGRTDPVNLSLDSDDGASYYMYFWERDWPDGTSFNGNDGVAGEGDLLVEVEQIAGGTGNDTLTGNPAANYLYGMGGVDLLDGDLGNDFLDGGSGTLDRVTYGPRNSPVVASLANGSGGETSLSEFDTILDVENLMGGASHDTLTGNGNANVLSGFLGDDTLNGLGGSDILNGESGADTMDGGTGGDTFVDSGVAEEWYGRIIDTVTYASRSNTVTVSLDGATNDGEASEGDRIDPDGGAIERVVGGSGDDFLTGGDGTGEILVGGPGLDTLSGLGGNDSLEGGVDADTLAGGGGDDTLEGGFQDDEMSGGAGEDTVDYTGHNPTPCTGFCPFDPRGPGVEVSLDDAANDGNYGNDSPFGGLPSSPLPAGDNVHSDVEKVIGSAGPDVLVDVETGAHLLGQAGNDRLVDGRGGGIIEGGDGFDTADFSNRVDVRANVSLNDVADDGSGTEGDNVRSDVEKVIGTNVQNTLTGNGGPNVLEGGGGNDVLNGGGGSDNLNGGAGTDTFDAGAGDDIINARDTPSPVAETLQCGEGADVAFVDSLDFGGGHGGGDCESVLRGPAVNTAPPALTGTPTKGRTLTASTGSWNEVSGATYAYQFLRCNPTCNSIADFGAANTYRLVAADVGATIRVRVRATTAEGSATSPDSNPTAAVADDTTPPDTTIQTGPSGPVASTTASFTFTATESGSTFECKLDTAAFATCVSGVSYSGLGQGGHTFQVRATDLAGNVDASPASRTWTVDTVVPDTTIQTGPSGPVASTTASFTFTSSEAGTFECSLDGGAFAPCASPKSYSVLSEGPHTFQVRATDGVGNTDPSPASRSWTVDTIPPGCTIAGTAGNDILVGTVGKDVICGLGGNDTIKGLGGNDVLKGAGGNDKLIGGGGADTLLGGAGNDTLTGSGGKDVLKGQGGNDLLLAKDGAKDTVNGGAGKDRAKVDRIDLRLSVEKLI